MQPLQDLIDLPWMRTVLGVLALLALAWLAGLLVRRLLLRVVRGITRRTAWRWDDALFRRHTFLWLARMVPALVIQFGIVRSEEHTSELQSLMRSSYAVFCLKKKK